MLSLVRRGLPGFLVILASLFCMVLAWAQPRQPMPMAKKTGRVPRRSPAPAKPECAKDAICFSGEISEGQQFRRPINSNLDFALNGGQGWVIAVMPHNPEGDCDEFARVANPPYRAHNPLEIDMTYGLTAEDETRDSPREFVFVTNCADFRVESDRLQKALWPPSEAEGKDAMAKLGTSPMGKGRFWITASRTSHTHGDPPEQGAIEWMAFSVEIKLPPRR